MLGDIVKYAGKQYGADAEKMVKASAILVNGRNAALLKGLRTRLQSGDEISILPPSAGG